MSNKKKKRKKRIKNLTINMFLMISVIIILIIFFELILRLFIDSPATTYQYNPTYVWEYRPNAKSSLILNGTKVEVSMNKDGFHDIEVRQKGNNRRILALGDSMIAATSLPIEQGTIHQLRLQLQDYDIINTGVSGWSTEQELLFLLSKGLDYNPDMVLLYFYIGNDLTTNYYRNYTTIDNGNLTLNPRSSKDKALVRNTFYFFETYSILYRLFRDATLPLARLEETNAKHPYCVQIGVEPTKRLIEDVFLLKEKENDDEIWRKNYLLIGYMNAVLKKKNIDFMVILVPDLIQIDTSVQKIVIDCLNLTTTDLDFQKPNKKLSKFLAQNNIKFIDTYDLFKMQSDIEEIYIPGDTHLNERGHKILADTIAKEIKK